MSAVSELASLKSRATLMGIDFHPSIGLAKLRAKIAVELAKSEPDEVVSALASVGETIPSRNKRLRMEANKLIRVNVACMNPNKKDHEGEIFTVSNQAIGTIKKFVPFNTENGYHVPEVILKMMQNRKCQIFVSKKNSRGNTTKVGKLIKEFAIEVLPVLTQPELEELKSQQALSGSID
jgi:hypothetical protein